MDKHKTLITVNIILLIILIFSSNFFLTIHNKKLYDKNFAENGVYEDLGVEGVRKITDNLINYLISENSEIDEVKYLFTEREISHLKDVSRLVSWIKYISIVALIVLAISLYWIIQQKKPENELELVIKKMLFYSGIITIAIIIIFSLLAFIDFTAFFTGFHKIFFPRGNYMFPNDYLLIKLFPSTFFLSAFKKIILQSLVTGIIFLGASFVIPLKKT